MEKIPTKIKRLYFKRIVVNITLDNKTLYAIIIHKERDSMRGREILKAIMKATGISNAVLAKRLNVSNATIWERLNNKNVKDIPVSLLSEMVRAMDYKVVVVPATSRLPEGGFEVTSNDEKKYDLTSLLSTDIPSEESPISKGGKIKLT